MPNESAKTSGGGRGTNPANSGRGIGGNGGRGTSAPSGANASGRGDVSIKPDNAGQSSGRSSRTGAGYPAPAAKPSAAPSSGNASPSGTSPAGGNAAPSATVPQGETDTTFGVVDNTAAPKNKGGRPVGYSPKKSASEKDALKGLAEGDVDQLSTGIVAAMNGAAAGLVGEWALMTPVEMDNLKKPLARILVRLDVKTAKVVQAYTDPFLLLMGLAAWGARLATIQQEQARIKRQEQAEQTLQQAAGVINNVEVNGNGAQTPIDPQIANNLSGGLT